MRVASGIRLRRRGDVRAGRAIALLVMGLLAACRGPVVRVPFAGELERFLASHPLADGQNVRADEIGRTASASYHVAQVRVGETPHRHLAHDLTVVVLRGRGTLTCDPAPIPLTAGDVAVIPRGQVHWFTNGGPAPAVALVVFAPPLDAPDSEPVR
jgi:quercetin dioxygenase-like cupin family protein